MRLAMLAIGLICLSPSAFAQVWYCDPLRVYYPAVQVCPVPWRVVAAPGGVPQSASQPVDNPALGNGTEQQRGPSIRNDGLDDWCSQATLPSSIAVCSDGDLRNLAIRRQKAFDEARARLNPDQQKELLTNQNAWVRSYARNCGLPDEPVLPLPEALKQCLSRSGQDRISAIQAFGLPQNRSAAASAGPDTLLTQPAAASPAAAPLPSAPIATVPQPTAAITAPTKGRAANNQDAGGGNVLLGAAVVLVVIVAPIVAYREMRRRAAERYRKQVEQRAVEAIAECIQKHERALIRKRFQTRRHDEYGIVREEEWRKAIEYFVEKVMIPSLIGHLTADEMAAVLRYPLAVMIDLTISQRAASEDDVTFGPTMTPIEFEQRCARELTTAGWTANTTKGSGDQGTDIIAQKGEYRLVVQCKLYSYPVGNKAVQEISAARMHERADFAIVVSNNRYTPSAEQLAATNNVLLLHYSDLKRIDDLVFA